MQLLSDPLKQEIEKWRNRQIISGENELSDDFRTCFRVTIHTQLYFKPSVNFFVFVLALKLFRFMNVARFNFVIDELL